MDLTPYLPIIVEATKFFFSELGKGLEHARQHAKVDVQSKTENSEHDSTFSKKDLALLENGKEFSTFANAQIAEANAITMKSLVEQIKVHINNLNGLETVQSQYGLLTPLHIKNEIEHESKQIIEKSERLQKLLSMTFNKEFEMP